MTRTCNTLLALRLDLTRDADACDVVGPPAFFQPATLALPSLLCAGQPAACRVPVEQSVVVGGPGQGTLADKTPKL